MRTFYYIISIVLTSHIFVGQKDSTYKVQVGTFKCSPSFKFQDSANLSWVNAETTVYEYYDEKKRKYVTKQEVIEPQGKFLSQSAPINPVTFHYPKRIDSVLTIRRDPDGKVREIHRYEKRVSDDHEFMNLHDSLCSAQLEAFWQSTVEVINLGKIQKFKSCAVSILYSDGLFFNTYIKNPKLLKNRQLVQQLKKTSTILAFSICDIWFKADNKKEYNIGDGFAWKVINCH